MVFGLPSAHDRESLPDVGCAAGGRPDDAAESAGARPIRILAEYLEPLETFRRERIHDTVVFFGSTRIAPDGTLGRYQEEARTLARLVTTWSKGLPTFVDDPRGALGLLKGWLQGEPVPAAAGTDVAESREPERGDGP